MRAWVRPVLITLCLLGVFSATPYGQDYYSGRFSGGSVTTPLLFPDGTVAAPAMAFASEPGLGWFRSGTSSIALAGNASKTIFSIASDGSIAMSNPSVNGGNAATLLQLDGSSLLRIAAGINATGRMVAYNGVTTAGWGVPAVYGGGSACRFTAQTAAKATVCSYTVGGSDGSFEVSDNFNATTATSFSITVTLAYTDETNTARTVTFQHEHAGSFVATLTNVTGAGPYHGIPLAIRVKAATPITVSTTGTFTTVTYNVESTITQIS